MQCLFLCYLDCVFLHEKQKCLCMWDMYAALHWVKTQKEYRNHQGLWFKHVEENDSYATCNII